MLYTVISLFIHHGVWGGGGRGPEKKTSVLSWKSQASKKLSTLRRFHTAADSSDEGKKNPGTKSDFSDERGVLEKPKRERVEVENEKEVQARHFRLCFAWEGERRRRRRRSARNKQPNQHDSSDFHTTYERRSYLALRERFERTRWWLA